MPGQADLAAGIAGGEQAPQLRIRGVAEAFVRGDQQPPDPIEGVVFAAAVAQGVVLGSAADLVDAVVREADHVERIGDLADMGQGDVEGAPVGAGEVQHAPVDALAPRLGLIQQPRRGRRGVATSDDVEQLAPGHVHNRGAPPAGSPAALAPEQGLIEAQCLHGADTVTVRGQQRLAPGNHRPHHRVPVTTQLRGHIGDRPSVAAHRHRRPAARPGCEPRTGRRDLLGDLSERPHSTTRRRATPPPLVPHQPHRPPERRQIHQAHRRRALRPHRPAAAPTDRPAPRPNVHRQRPRRLVVDAEDLHIAQTDQQLADTRRVLHHRGPPLHRCLSHPILGAPTPAIADPVPAQNRRARYPRQASSAFRRPPYIRRIRPLLALRRVHAPHRLCTMESARPVTESDG